MKQKKQLKVKTKKLSLQNKNILVTGGNGFIGSHLVDAIVFEKPSRLVVVDRGTKSKLSNLTDALKRFSKIEVLEIDVTNFKRLPELLKRIKFDVVFHLAALSLLESLVNPKKVVLTNVMATVNLLELQRQKLFQTLILISSSEAYGTADFVPMDEKHPLHPTTPYAASKASADLIALSYYQTFGNDLTIVRPFNNYGPRQNLGFKGIITHTIQLLLSNQQPIIYGTGGQTRDYIFVKDTARGIIDAYKYPSTRGQIINLGSGKMIKMKDLVKKLIKISGRKVSISFQKARVADVKNHCADITLANRLMGWKPEVDIEDGLKQTYEWFKNQINE